MGKYTKKPKITCDVSVMEVGVRTRAKTLALQKLKSSNPDTSSSYLQLRSCRIEKVLPPRPPPKTPSPKKNSSSRANSSSGMANSASVRSNSIDREMIGGEFEENWSVDASFGENDLELDGRARSTRESTPCSYIREPIITETPGSGTRQTSSTAANRRAQRISPTAEELEDFFASVEKQQQKLFADKYNFDAVNEVPLPGRYEWVKVEN